MIHKINNNSIYISVNTDGAELCSLCDVHGMEYIWQPQPDCWSQHSPILFPIVGAQKENKYIYGGKTYNIPMHGFAAGSRFKVVEKLSDKLTLRLTDNAETKKSYPFSFCFDVSYELSGESLYVRFKITNNSENAMPFAVGGHPGFRVPLEPEEKYEDYTVKFDCIETCKAPILVHDAIAEASEFIQVLNNTQYLPLSHTLFKKGVLVLESLKSRGVTLYSNISGRGVKVDFEGFDNLGLWNWNNADFLCIEPWSSPGSFSDPDGLLEKRKGIRMLPKGETAEYGYKITVI